MSDTKMEAYEVNLQTEPVVVFCDPEKAQFFFIDDPDDKAWSKFFWSVTSLGKLAEMLAKMFYHQKDCWGDPFLEGFGVVKYNEGNDTYFIEGKEFGKIIIEMEDLDHHWDYVNVTKKLDKELARLVK
ncbi:hypothetical protein JAVIER_175 [Vibrio phage Javier]|uniref:Uncharacterized protein n=2 Tax=Thalassavirus TaxID=2948922 RepID=A0A6M4EUN5_9CAUD|nr:hypothetical protein KNU87_gp129 [Vibrio phage Bennett]YP_010108584.1 hypothetical protein KNV08_gp136 [Vibrio phage Quinn]QKE61016.1 hypothetical protein DAX_179 [Vibrio phage Dax]QKN84625.1 hypothetical protein BBMUFFIN_181 [Vibrio phage BBMuffin]QKN85598.1 hypothetical protein DIREPILLOW8_178 [Vibrio phage Direpillow8]WBU76396.1 hypothetical protein WYMAN_181 [Vibrio phage Wyman]WBU76586.1 hypothetical protein CHLORIS_177 [Vibrio phage Chloris]WBU76772.1 hypothetical protein JAVIER_175